MKINFNKFFQNWNQMKANTGLMNRSITDAFAGAIEEDDEVDRRVPVQQPALPQEPLPKPIDAKGVAVQGTYFNTPIGGVDYTYIKDTDDNRQMIVLDESGNVDPSSPVIPVGKDVGGGFILMARSDSKLPREVLPITKTRRGLQVSYPQAVENVNIFPSMMKQAPVDVSSAVSTSALGELVNLYGVGAFGSAGQTQ